MQAKSEKIKSILVFLFWVAFISCCIGAGVFLVGYLRQIFTHNYTLKIMDQDFSPLLSVGLVTYHLFMVINLGLIILLAILLFQILQLFRLFAVEDPFHKTLSRLLLKIAQTFLWCAIMSVLVMAICSLVPHFHPESASDSSDIFTFLLMAAVLYLIAQVFRKGENLQAENELTV